MKKIENARNAYRLMQRPLPHTYLIQALRDMKKLHNPFSTGAVECLLKIIASKTGTSA